MAFNYKILGQLFPAAATLSALYTVPASTTAIISSITCCNHSNSASDTIRISVSKNGEADASKQYIYGGSSGGGLRVTKNDTFAAQLGLTLSAGDIVRVYSLNGTSSFNLFGTEITS